MPQSYNYLQHENLRSAILNFIPSREGIVDPRSDHSGQDEELQDTGERLTRWFKRYGNKRPQFAA